MFLSVATEPGSERVPNEDWVAVSPRVVVVLDGVTILDQGVTSGCRHGTPWYVNQLGIRLLTTAADEAVPLVAILAKAIRDVAALHDDTCDLARMDAPSAAVAVVRIGDRVVDFLVLADVTILLDMNTGLRVITDDRVASTVHDLQGQVDVGGKVMQRRAQFRNREWGYWVAAADPDAASHAITGRASIAELRHIAVMTDGVTRLVAPFRCDDWPDILAHAVGAGARSLLRRVRSVEAGDPQGTRWPRFKVSDDATVAVIGLDPQCAELERSPDTPQN